MKFRVDVRVLKGTAAILAVVLVLLAGMLLLQRWENTQDAPVSSSGPSSAVEADAPVDGREITYYNGTAYARREDLETVLLLGVDKFEGETPEGYINNQQADFLLLLVMDKQHETCTPIQLNRDTMTQIQILGVTGEPAGTFTGQLALAHTPDRPVLLDAGCGEGYYTQGVREALLSAGKTPHVAGFDISKFAVQKAARRCPDLDLAVATAYHLPVGDGAVDLVMNVFSPLAIEEFRRVLKKGRGDITSMWSPPPITCGS